MPEAEAKSYHINPFDLTKVWPHGDYPLIEFGELVLNRNVQNYFAEVEQAAFSPANVVPGIGFSPDKMLQARLFSYHDAHLYRIGTNYQLLPVNRARAAQVRNYQRDGAMRFDDNYGPQVNYEPNSSGDPLDDPVLEEAAYSEALGGLAARYDEDYEGNDDYTQPGDLFRLMTPEQKERLINNIAGHLKPVSLEIKVRQIRHFHHADPAYGEGVARALDIGIGEITRAGTKT
jgi:catalase